MGIVIESSHEKRTSDNQRYADRKSMNRSLRFIPSETTVAAVGLMILVSLSKQEIN